MAVTIALTGAASLLTTLLLRNTVTKGARITADSAREIREGERSEETEVNWSDFRRKDIEPKPIPPDYRVE
ncbi:hypothetical protein [Amycolatopsis sp. NPDC098790]|uniref:hypothetical protein n=1 Tax=Amycolatopsis sp. NPDC098790 TaxID=3363939 RepID=UPI0038281FDE